MLVPKRTEAIFSTMKNAKHNVNIYKWKKSIFINIFFIYKKNFIYKNPKQHFLTHFGHSLCEE